MTPQAMALRSSTWFAHADSREAWPHRSFMNKAGYPPDMLHGKPIIGICNSWSELTPCNLHLRQIAESVKHGILRPAAYPSSFRRFR